MMKSIYFLFFISLLLSCTDNDVEFIEIEDPFTPTEISYTTIAQTLGTGVSQESTVIRAENQDIWWNYIEYLQTEYPQLNLEDYFAEIDINFDEYMLIHVAESPIPDTSYRVEIQRITEYEDSLVVETDVIQPYNTAFSVLSSAQHLVKITKNNKEVIFHQNNPYSY